MTIIERKSKLRYIALTILISLSYLFDTFSLHWLLVVVLPVTLLLLDIYKRETRILAEYGASFQMKRLAISVYYLLMTSSGIFINMRRADFSRFYFAFTPIEIIFLWIPLVSVNSEGAWIFDEEKLYASKKDVLPDLIVALGSAWLSTYNPFFVYVGFLALMLYYLYGKTAYLENEEEIIVGWGRIILILTVGRLLLYAIHAYQRETTNRNRLGAKIENS